VRSNSLHESLISHIYIFHETRVKESWHTYEGVMLHLWRSHVTPMKESWYTYEWVMSHIWLNHIAHMNESRQTCKWVMSHILMSQIFSRTCLNMRLMNRNWCRAYAWVPSRERMSHFMHMYESWHTQEWMMSHVWMHHITHGNISASLVLTLILGAVSCVDLNIVCSIVVIYVHTLTYTYVYTAHTRTHMHIRIYTHKHKHTHTHTHAQTHMYVYP